MHERRDLKKLHTGFRRPSGAPKTDPRKLRGREGSEIPERRAVSEDVGGDPDYVAGKPVTYRAEHFFVNDLERVGKGTRKAEKNKRDKANKEKKESDKQRILSEQRLNGELLFQFRREFKKDAWNFLNVCEKKAVKGADWRRTPAVFLRELGFENFDFFTQAFGTPFQAGKFVVFHGKPTELALFVKGIGPENLRRYIMAFSFSRVLGKLQTESLKKNIADAKRVLKIP